MSPEEQRTLFALARAAIAARLANESPPDLPAETPTLTQAAGAFVTLKLRGELRGCIGRIQSSRPLVESVRDLAVAAGFQDHRFQPLQPDEFPELELEISVLTPPWEVPPGDLPDAIRVGTHGLIVRYQGRSGLLLPQVASERGWNPLTFLEQTSLKAGLHSEAWSAPGATVEAFACEVYQEPSSGT